MKTYNAKDIRNVAIAGQRGTGKTTLAEAMLYLAKATERLGRVADGNAILDFEADEKKLGRSISTAMAAAEWNNTKINILDTPGGLDFAGGVAEGIRAAESVLITLASGEGVGVGAAKAFKAANKRGIAKIFVITKNDADNANADATIDALKAEYGSKVCPVVFPVDGAYVDLITNKAYTYAGGKATEAAMPAVDDVKEAFIEAVAGADEELMEKFFEGEELTADEIAKGLKAGVAAGEIYPVFVCSGYNTDAVDLLLNGLVAAAPDATNAGENVDESASVEAICFKTVENKFGRMSFFKVVAGKLDANTPAYNVRKDKQEKMGKMVFVKGEKQEEATVITAGDIGVVTKLENFKTGDTLCNPKADTELPGVDYPLPCYSKAIRAAKKGEEDKVAQGLNKIVLEDPTVGFETNVETHEQIVSTLGERHMDLVVNKLRDRFHVEVELSTPKVAYRETITGRCEVQGRHKKQSGGSGQFGDVWVRFEPLEGEGFEFVDAVVGGAVPRNFIPSVEKGLRQAIQKGPLAGCPVVGVKATLYDGSSHPVDSNDMAFQTAARIAFKKALTDKANETRPKILEPIGLLKVTMPDDKLGDIMGIVTKKRGRPLGSDRSEDDPKMTVFEAHVPMSEMSNFAIDLRSITTGSGSFTLDLDHYEAAPEPVAQKVIAEAAVDNED